MKGVVISSIGFVFGIIVGWYILFVSPQTALFLKDMFFPSKHIFSGSTKTIIGFLPYWLVEKAKTDYSDTITTLTYFGLTIGIDGHIQYFANEAEEEPGWHALKSTKMANMLQIAKKTHMSTSLLVFSGDSEVIDTLISDPITHAQNLAQDVIPQMKKYGFSDLNIDIESTKDASDTARENFSIFVSEIKRQLQEKNAGTLTIEITGNDLIRKELINPKDMGHIADYVVIMAYDFHYANSYVTGPVAPIGGADSEAEFDTTVVLSQAYKVIPKDKIVLGIPSYGYGWETLQDTPRAAVLPGSGLTMSSEKTENLLLTCPRCRVQYDTKAAESFITYTDDSTGTIHQIYYPNEKAMSEKMNLVKQANLAGVAIWALGYESPKLYESIKGYKSEMVDITHL